MVTPKVGFIVYGVHKDGLQDPMGTPFIDDQLIANAKNALREAGLELVEPTSSWPPRGRPGNVLPSSRRWMTWTPLFCSQAPGFGRPT